MSFTEEDLHTNKPVINYIMIQTKFIQNYLYAKRK